MKVHVTKAYLDMARSVIDTAVHGDREAEISVDAIFSLMSCTYVFSYMALTSFCASHLHKLWVVDNSRLKEKFGGCRNFEELMAGPLKEIKVALSELCSQLGIEKLHVARPKVWRELNELLKGYRDYFIHPNPESFHEHVEATGNLKWGFPSMVATEIISYFFEATHNQVPSWVKQSGLRSKGFEVLSQDGAQ